MRIAEPIRTQLKAFFDNESDFNVAEKEAVDRYNSDQSAVNGKRDKIPFSSDKFKNVFNRITVVYLSPFDFEE